MKDKCIEHGVKILGIPRIGCGLDGLVWCEVKFILNELFWDTDIQINVYRI